MQIDRSEFEAVWSAVETMSAHAATAPDESPDWEVYVDATYNNRYAG